MWTASTKVFVTRVIFMEMMTEVFVPAVKKYLEKPMKSLFVMETFLLILQFSEKNSTTNITSKTSNSCYSTKLPCYRPWINRLFIILRNCIPRHFFKAIFHVQSDTDLTPRDFWKDHFDIFNCIKIIEKA